MTDQPRGIWLDTPLMGKPQRDAAPPLSARFHEDARKVIARYPEGQERSALLPLLYLAQAEQNYVSPRAMEEIGGLLGLTQAQVAAVATFYTMFKRDPQGKWLVSVCTQPSCAMAGSVSLLHRLQQEIDSGPASDPDAVTVEEVECLCACDGAPVFQVNYENYERMNIDDAVDLVRKLRNGEQPPPGARGDAPQDANGVSRRLSGVEAPR